MELKAKLTSIYHSIFPELLEIEFPDEIIADCSNCNFCRSLQSPNRNTKCCSYHPTLANFLVGGILLSGTDKLLNGVEVICNKINSRHGITPYSIMPSPGYISLGIDNKNYNFGTRPTKLTEDQLCPFYYAGSCLIWEYRENLCSIYFCSSIGGLSGKYFWKNVKRYLKLAETSLAQYAMQQLGWPPTKIKTEAVTTSDFNLEDEQGNIIEENYKKLWGEWAGREEEFYIKCYEIVSKVDAETFKRITGLKREILEAAIRDTQKDFLKNVLPEKLLLHPEVVAENAEEGYTNLRLGEVSAKIPSVIFPLVRAFNGQRSTVEVFHFGYNVLYNMSEIVDELREKGILVKT